MLVDKVIKAYDVKNDLNCAEAILVAGNEEYDLGITKQTLKTMSAFGGGMAIGSVCGAITGAISVIGIMFTEERGHQSPQVKEMTNKFINRFNEALGEINCIPLKEKYYDANKEKRCIIMMKLAAEVLENIINEYKEVYPIYR